MPAARWGAFFVYDGLWLSDRRAPAPYTGVTVTVGV